MPSDNEAASPLPTHSDVSGTEWSEHERMLIVHDYFSMLKAELKGEDYNKSEHRRNVMELLPGRTHGSVERKHQNVSAVMELLGLPRIAGYVPFTNIQAELLHTVEEVLGGDPELRQLIARRQELARVGRDEETAADLLANPRKRLSQGFMSDVKRRRTIESRAVESASSHYESLRFDVEDVGDRESYDLRCTRDGQELHVEVKGTTTAGETVHLTKNEVAHARECPRVALYVLRDVAFAGDGNSVEATGGVPLTFEPWVIDEGSLTATVYRYELPKPSRGRES